MTAKAALALAFLEGRTINIKNCFETIGLSNAPRECSRMIEQPFGVVLTRTRMEGKSRYGQAITWFNYRLHKDAEHNRDGVAKMRIYVSEQLKSNPPKTDNQDKKIKKAKSIIESSKQQSFI